MTSSPAVSARDASSATEASERPAVRFAPHLDPDEERGLRLPGRGGGRHAASLASASSQSLATRKSSRSASARSA